MLRLSYVAPVVIIVSTVVVYTLHTVHQAPGGQKKWYPLGLFSSLAGSGDGGTHESFKGIESNSNPHTGWHWPTNDPMISTFSWPRDNRLVKDLKKNQVFHLMSKYYYVKPPGRGLSSQFLRANSAVVPGNGIFGEYIQGLLAVN